MAYTCALFDNNYIKYYSSTGNEVVVCINIVLITPTCILFNFTVINSPYKFQTDARINRGIECNIISFEITEMNGRPVEKMISIDLVYKFWAAFGFSNEVLLEKEAQVCLLKVYRGTCNVMKLTVTLITLRWWMEKYDWYIEQGSVSPRSVFARNPSTSWRSFQKCHLRRILQLSFSNVAEWSASMGSLFQTCQMRLWYLDRRVTVMSKKEH